MLEKRLAEEKRLDAKYTRTSKFNEVDLYPGLHKLTFMKMNDEADDRIKNGYNVYYNVRDKYGCMKLCEDAPEKEVDCYPKTKEFASCLSSGTNDCYNKFDYKNMHDYSATPTKVKVGCNSYLYNSHSKDSKNNSCTIHRSCPDRMDEFEFNNLYYSYSSEFGYNRDKPLNYIIQIKGAGFSEDQDLGTCKEYCDSTKGCKNYSLTKMNPNTDRGDGRCRLTF